MNEKIITLLHLFDRNELSEEALKIQIVNLFDRDVQSHLDLSLIFATPNESETNTVSEQAATVLAESIILCTWVTSIVVTKVSVPSGFMSVLFGEQSWLQDISFSEVDLGDKGAMTIANVIRFNSHLKNLSLDACEIDNDGVDALASSLINHVALTHLSLRANVFVIGYNAIALLVQHNTMLKSLDLQHRIESGFHPSGIEINKDHVQQFATALSENTTLTSLRFTQDQITQAALKLLVYSTMNCQSLTSLTLYGLRVDNDQSYTFFDVLKVLTLNRVNVSGKRMDQTDEVIELIAENHERVTEVKFLYMLNDDQCVALANALQHNTHIKHLTLSSADLGVLQMRAILEGLLANTSVEKLSFNSGISNWLKSLERLYFGEWLQKNRTVRVLSLGSFSYTDAGLKVLEDSLTNASTCLRKITLDNIFRYSGGRPDLTRLESIIKFRQGNPITENVNQIIRWRVFSSRYFHTAITLMLPTNIVKKIVQMVLQTSMDSIDEMFVAMAQTVDRVFTLRNFNHMVRGFELSRYTDIYSNSLLFYIPKEVMLRILEYSGVDDMRIFKAFNVQANRVQLLYDKVRAKQQRFIRPLLRINREAVIKIYEHRLCEQIEKYKIFYAKKLQRDAGNNHSFFTENDKLNRLQCYIEREPEYRNSSCCDRLVPALESHCEEYVGDVRFPLLLILAAPRNNHLVSYCCKLIAQSDSTLHIVKDYCEYLVSILAITQVDSAILLRVLYSKLYSDRLPAKDNEAIYLISRRINTCMDTRFESSWYVVVADKLRRVVVEACDQYLTGKKKFHFKPNHERDKSWGVQIAKALKSNLQQALLPANVFSTIHEHLLRTNKPVKEPGVRAISFKPRKKPGLRDTSLDTFILNELYANKDLNNLLAEFLDVDNDLAKECLSSRRYLPVVFRPYDDASFWGCNDPDSPMDRKKNHQRLATVMKIWMLWFDGFRLHFGEGQQFVHLNLLPSIVPSDQISGLDANDTGSLSGNRLGGKSD